MPENSERSSGLISPVEVRGAVDAHERAAGLVRYQIARLQARNKELEDLFHLQQSRMGEAVEYWQKKTGRHDHTPPLGELLTFLLNEITRQTKKILVTLPQMEHKAICQRDQDKCLPAT